MERLTVQEEEAMRAVWRTGRGIISDFLLVMDDPKPPYTTLASTIKNLKKKQFLSATKLGGVYTYQPLIESERYQTVVIKDIIGNYFKGSYKELVTFFATEKAIDADELKSIIHLIENKNAD